MSVQTTIHWHWKSITVSLGLLTTSLLWAVNTVIKKKKTSLLIKFFYLLPFPCRLLHMCIIIFRWNRSWATLEMRIYVCVCHLVWVSTTLDWWSMTGRWWRSCLSTKGYRSDLFFFSVIIRFFFLTFIFLINSIYREAHVNYCVYWGVILLCSRDLSFRILSNETVLCSCTIMCAHRHWKNKDHPYKNTS